MTQKNQDPVEIQVRLDMLSDSEVEQMISDTGMDPEITWFQVRLARGEISGDVVDQMDDGESTE